jgi:hypothetical protein
MVRELAPLKITSEFLTWREISTPTTIVGQLDKVGVEGDNTVNVWKLLEDKVLDEDDVLARKGRMRAEKVLEVEDDEVTCHVTGETYSPRTHWHCASTYVTLAKGGGRGRSKGGPKEESAGGIKMWKGWMASIKTALKSADHVKALEKQLLKESGHSKPSDVIRYFDDLVTVRTRALNSISAPPHLRSHPHDCHPLLAWKPKFHPRCMRPCFDKCACPTHCTRLGNRYRSWLGISWLLASQKMSQRGYASGRGWRALHGGMVSSIMLILSTACGTSQRASPSSCQLS